MYQYLKYSWAFIFFSHHAFAVDLMEVYAIAENNDPAYQEIISLAQATTELKLQAQASLLPSVNINANTSINHEEYDGGFSTISGDSARFNRHGYSLNISQPLFRWDRYLTLKQADSMISQAEARQMSAWQQLIIRVAENYFAILAAIDSLEFAKAGEKSLARQLEQIKQQFDAGLTTIINLQEAQAGFDEAVANRILNENQLDNARENLREITGEYIAKLTVLQESLPLVNPQPDNIEQWMEIAELNNMDVITARYKLENLRQEIKKQNAVHLPTLDLVANYGHNRTGGRFGTNETNIGHIGLELNIPIYQGGFVSSKAREAKHYYAQSLHEVKRFLRLAQKNTRQSYLGIISAISRINALKQAIISSETALQATISGFDAGTRTAVDVIMAEHTALRAKRENSAAQYTYLLDTLRLKQATGTLNLKDLKQINNWLN